MTLYYTYRKDNGEFAGSGLTRISTDDYESTTEAPRETNATAPVFDGEKWVNVTNGGATVTPRQIRLALLAAGVDLAAIDQMLAENPAAKIEWEYATQVDKSHALIRQFAAALSLTDEQVDGIFKLAAGL